jgi:hypothetical protein
MNHGCNEQILVEFVTTEFDCTLKLSAPIPIVNLSFNFQKFYRIVIGGSHGKVTHHLCQKATISSTRKMKGRRLKREVDCGNKSCSLEHHVLNTCVLVLPTNVTNCNIPCEMSGCKTEIHHLISCPGKYNETWL